MNKKSERSELESKRKSFLLLGAVIALSVSLISFEWKSFPTDFADLGMINIEDIDDELVPITVQKPETKPPVRINVTEEIKIVDNDSDEDTTTITFFEDTVPFYVEPEPEVEDNTDYISVQHMPTLPGCEGIMDEGKRATCTQQKMYQHLGKVQKYPQMMKEAGVEGTVFVSFVVDKKGDIARVEVLKGVAGGKQLDKEAVRMVKSFPKFNPGMQQGKNVNVRYNLPISFKLR